MTPAITYKRFSSKAQEGNSSLDRQTSAIDTMVKDRDWHVVEEIEDLGRSAWHGDHLKTGNLGKFKARVDAGEIDPGTILVIDSLDRLSRQNVKKARRWVEEVTEAGVKVAVASKNKVFDDASLSGENIIDLLEYLLEAKRSHEESQEKSRRNTGAWRKAEKDAEETGRLITRTVPAWITVDAAGNRIEIPERGDIVRRIYRLSAAGMGYMSIARTLNDERVEPWGARYNKTKLWEWSYIRNVLRHPAVEGEYHCGRKIGRPTGQVIEGYYPRVVDEALVAQARSAGSSRSRTGGANYRNPANLFAGLMKCELCGANMIRRPSRSLSHERAGKQASYLQCYDAKRGSDCSNRGFYRYEHFEKAALEVVLGLALQDQFFKRSDEAAVIVNQLAQARKKLETKKAQQTRLLDFIMETDDAVEAKARLNLLRPEVDESASRVAELEEALARARGKLSPDEQAKRVIAMANAINSDDEQVRMEARMTVRDALAAVLDKIICSPVDRDTGEERRVLSLWAADNHVRYDFDNEGAIIRSWNLLDESRSGEPVEEAISTEFADNERHSGTALRIAQRNTADDAGSDR